MIRVTPRARRREDLAGDPLDGLVNLFDLGIVLSVGFLLAALSALNLASSLTEDDEKDGTPESGVVAPKDAQISDVPSDGETVIGQGVEVGSVYRLPDGRLVYVVPSEQPSSSPSGTP